MSTRSSIWYAEEKGKTVHIYGELGEREMKNGRGVAAPVYIAVDEGGDLTGRILELGIEHLSHQVDSRSE